MDHGARASSQSRTVSKSNTGGSYFHVYDVLAVTLFAIVALLVYSANLEGPFVFDDTVHIPDNPHIRLQSLSLKDMVRAGFESLNKNRPVANISFALNYYFHKYDVMGYHLVNILIHVMTGILLYFFTKTTLSLPPLRSRYESHGWIAFFTALIWLVHPIQTQSVSYIVQRMNSMAAMFYILSFLLYVRARLADEKRKKRVLLAGCILAGILALGSKEIAATLPFFILLYEWYFFQDLNWTWLKRHLFIFAGVLVLLAIVAFVYLGASPLERILESYNTRDFTLAQRVLTQFRVVIFYISLLIFPYPSRLNLDHHFPVSHSLLDPLTTILSIGVVIGLIGVACHMAKRNRVLSFCILWFLGNLLIESSVIGLELVFEHRNYLPSMLVSLMAVTLAHRHTRAKWLGFGVTCAVVMVFSFWAHERNTVWSDDVTLWRDSVNKSPQKARPHYSLAHALERQGRREEAISHNEEALRIKPDYAKAHYNLANALVRQGRLEEAISHYEEALRIRPGFAKANNNLGVALARQGDLKEAIRHFSEALRIKPDFAEARQNLEQGLQRMGKSSGRRKAPSYPGNSEVHTSIAK